MKILFWTEQKNHEKKNFEELVCQVNSCPYMCWFSMKLKIIGKFCFIIFRANGHFLLFFVFCIVWHVIATSSWIFIPNVEKCDFKYLFWGPMWF